MKKLKSTVCSLGVLVAASGFGAKTWTIPAPDGVGDVVALTNAIAELNAISAADADKTLNTRIYLQPGVYNLKGVKMTSSSHLNIKHARNFIFAGLGNGPEDTILIGGGSEDGCRVINAEGGGNYWNNVYSNITVTGGYVASSGGGIYGGNPVTVYVRCIISNNVANVASNYRWSGGGGCAQGSARQCLFANNTCNGAGGGLFSGDGFKASKKFEAYVEDCIFSNNTQTAHYSEDGGGACSSAIIRRCKFFNNVAKHGGAVGSSETAGLPRCYDCYFENNSSAYGGAVSNPIVLSNCTFVANSSTYIGGAVYAAQAPTAYYRSGAFGGVTYYAPTNSFVIMDCAFSNSVAASHGGAMYVPGCITNCMFYGNTCNGNGAGACISDVNSAFGVCDSHFVANTAPGTSGGCGNGAGVYDAHGVAIVGCTFKTNFSRSSGGGACVVKKTAGSGVFDSRFEGNRAAYSGGWAFGGGVYGSDGLRPVVSNCVFVGGSASRGSAFQGCDVFASAVTGYSVGSLIIADSNLYGCFVTNNATTVSNGDLDGYNSESKHSACTNVNCVIANNRCGSYCHLISNKTLINCSFVSNDWSNAGNYGGLISEGCVAFNSLFTGNKINSSYIDLRTRYGGGSGSKAKAVTNCVFSALESNVVSDRFCDCKVIKRKLLHLDDAGHPYALCRGSRARDIGTLPDWIRNAVGDADIYGMPRICNEKIDVGASECQDSAPFGNVLMLK